jgi:hypothetical protein
MTQFGRIDDPLDASFAAWPEEESNRADETALTVGELLSHLVTLGVVMRDRFLSKNRAERFNYLLRGVRLKFIELEKRLGGAEEQIKAVCTKVASLEFQEAAAAAAEESIRATNLQKIDQFSSILVGSADPTMVADSPADAAVLIRDVAQLTSMDIQVLHHLEEAYGHLFPTYPNVHDPNVFTEKFQDFKDAARRSGLHPEEFQSVCERLRGFGFVAEVLRNTSRMAPGDYCYRPTRRGLKLLRLLGKSGNETQSRK